MNDGELHTDIAFLARIVAGDEGAMRALFRSFYPRLCLLAIELTGDEQEAEDMAQEALSAFWMQRAGFSASSMKEVSAFLFTVVRNRSFNYLKHQKVKHRTHQELVADQPGYDDTVEAQFIKADLYYQIYQEMQALPEAQRRVLRLIFVEGLDTQEVADRLQITPNNVRNQKARALEKLRPLLLKNRLSFTILAFF